MMFGMSQNAAGSGRIPLCMFDNRVERDKWGNDVSIWRVWDGRNYRIVHFSKRHQYKQKAVIYGGKNKFLRLEWNMTDNPCAMLYLKIGDWELAWGDGDPCGADYFGKLDQNNPIIIDLKQRLSNIHDENFDEVLNIMIDHCDTYDQWQSKELKNV